MSEFIDAEPDDRPPISEKITTLMDYGADKYSNSDDVRNRLAWNYYNQLYKWLAAQRNLAIQYNDNTSRLNAMIELLLTTNLSDDKLRAIIEPEILKPNLLVRDIVPPIVFNLIIDELISFEKTSQLEAMKIDISTLSSESCSKVNELIKTAPKPPSKTIIKKWQAHIKRAIRYRMITQYQGSRLYAKLSEDIR